MDTDMPPSEDAPRRADELHQRLQAGDQSALGELFDLHRERLWRMVQFRMDRRLAARLDPDDILQEAFVNAASRLQHYLQDPSRSLFVWFRLIVAQTMVDVYRRHLAAEMRDAGREVSLQGMKFPQATSVSLAAELLGSVTSPSQAAAREEAAGQLEAALQSMSELDQEVIALRHFEDLTNSEVAEVLGIQPTAASNRYVRALTRLKQVLEGIPGFDPQQG
jgi:RNA polymerase sigma-70 factor (ECF subfamily)